jgi:hypothetical protein
MMMHGFANPKFKIKWLVSSAAASYAQILHIIIIIIIINFYVSPVNIMSLPADTVKLFKYIP